VLLGGNWFTPEPDLFATPGATDAIEAAKTEIVAPPAIPTGAPSELPVAPADIHVRVLATDGSLAPGARAQLRNYDGSILLRPDRDEAGDFVFRELPSKGPWIASAMCEGTTPVFRGSVVPGQRVTFVLAHSMAMYTEVVDDEGFRVEDAKLVVYSGEGELPEEIARLEMFRNDDGRYYSHIVPRVPGRAVARLGKASTEVAFKAPAEGDLTLRIVWPDLARVEGMVVDETGARLAGIHVAARNVTGEIGTAVSQADGRYALHLEEGERVSVRARPDNGLRYSAAEVKDVVVPARGVDLRLPLNPEAPAIVSARVLAPDGTPVKDVRVTYFIDGFSGPVGSRSDENLRGEPLRVSLSVTGNLRAEFRSSVGFARVGPVAIERRSEVDLGEVRLQAAASATGRIVGPDGSPVDGWRILIAQGGASEPVTGDAEGRFKVEGLPPEDTVLHLVHNHFETVQLQVLAGPGETFDVGTVKLRAGTAVLRGSVTRSTSPGTVDVVLTRPIDATSDAPEYRATVDDHGRFEIPGLPAGTYDTSVQRKESSDEHSRFYTGRGGPKVVLAEGETKEIVMPAIE
jgi:hypothetical protein